MLCKTKYPVAWGSILAALAFTISCASAKSPAGEEKVSRVVENGTVALDNAVIPLPAGIKQIEEFKAVSDWPAYLQFSKPGNSVDFGKFKGEIVRFYEGKIIAGTKISKFKFPTDTYADSRNCASLEQSKGVTIIAVHSQKKEIQLQIYAPTCPQAH